MVLLDTVAQFAGSAMVPMVPGLVLTPAPETPVTETVTMAPLANVLFPDPARWIPTSAGLVMVEPRQTVPKLRPSPGIDTAPSPSATTLSARAAAADQRIKVAAAAATGRVQL